MSINIPQMCIHTLKLGTNSLKLFILGLPVEVHLLIKPVKHIKHGIFQLFIRLLEVVRAHGIRGDGREPVVGLLVSRHCRNSGSHLQNNSLLQLGDSPRPSLDVDWDK